MSSTEKSSAIPNNRIYNRKYKKTCNTAKRIIKNIVKLKQASCRIILHPFNKHCKCKIAEKKHCKIPCPPKQDRNQYTKWNEHHNITYILYNPNPTSGLKICPVRPEKIQIRPMYSGWCPIIERYSRNTAHINTKKHTDTDSPKIQMLPLRNRIYQ